VTDLNTEAAVASSSASATPKSRARLVLTIIFALIALGFMFYMRFVGISVDTSPQKFTGSSVPTASTSQPTIAPTVAPAPSTLDLPAESITDSPTEVVTYIEQIRAKAFETGNIAYLDHYYDYPNNRGYVRDASNINGGNRATKVTITNIRDSVTNAPGDVHVTFERQFDHFPPITVYAHYVFMTGEWRLKDSHG
jgi:hypothetical protein